MAPSASQRPAQSSAADPSYVRPSYPLNREAQFAIDELLRSSSLTSLEKHLSQASDLLTQSAGEINDRLHESQTRLTKQRERLESREADGARLVQEREEQLGEMRERVETMTEKMEEQVRKIIDAQNGLEEIRNSVAAVQGECSQLSHLPGRTQARPSQRSRTQRVADDEDEDRDTEMVDADENEEQEELPEWDFPIASDIFQSRLEAAKHEYQSLSLATRYANHNTYIDFRRLVHDSQHPNEDGPPLPRPETWFPEGDAPGPGVTLFNQGASRPGAEEESDEDLAVSRATISTKCPLTLQEFKDPVTSQKCPHSFERDAIIGIIKRSTLRVGGNEYVRCPVGGCKEHITESDLHTDSVLIRKIRRIQRAAAADEDEDGGDEKMDDDAFDELEDDDEVAAVRQRKIRRGTTVPPKTEPRNSGVTGRPSVSERSSGVTQTVDLGSDTEE
ncbi:hypothetical protein P152DRAFT_441287 [Eremomyces bilateralis CBS 781.70]|uniref:SP-RING-type domain-containing protein n=1 Tax=Eremomyces bilateralis CBS 781.70 TaxID=1392243 RepID=A0A6G1FVT9_9PEZI|nr:uncharacterized protein P152DRAFT_441287 [Eremomyces bilateralis CBS 781.70]KAF1809802.1 hypothetical protein P152DRAFT_441287 [Eremomyces bilateralis CBS 781.70]